MLLDINDSLLLLVDLQGSLMHKVMDGDRVTAVSNKLVSIARELSVPILLTEHYPEGLKPTVPAVAEHLGKGYRPIKKKIFSCYGDDGFRLALQGTGRKSILITGIETHICILQTALQCREAGYRVFVAADGVSCRSRLDHDLALDRMVRAGVDLVTWEMAAYEWMRRADHPAFKRVLPHIKAGLEKLE